MSHREELLKDILDFEYQPQELPLPPPEVLAQLTHLFAKYDEMVYQFNMRQALTKLIAEAYPKLTNIPVNALKKLDQCGYTLILLNNWLPSSTDLTLHHFHTQLLLFLTKKQQMTPKNAIKEIAQLDKWQAKTLHELWEKGLRGDHLRQLQQESEQQIPSEDLNEILKECILDNKFSITDALEAGKSIYAVGFTLD